MTKGDEMQDPIRLLEASIKIGFERSPTEHEMFGTRSEGSAVENCGTQILD